MVVPRVNIYMIGAFGWDTAWRFWGIGLIIAFLPLMWLLIVNKPEDIGLLPDNVTVHSEEDLEKELAQVAQSSFTLNEALRTKEFWFIGIISMTIPMISTGMLFHFYSIMSSKGFDSNSTAYIIGLMALPGLIMPLIAGTIIDRYRSRYIVSITLLVMMLDLICFRLVSSMVGAATFILIYGFFTNVQVITLNVIWVKYFGRLHLGAIRGAATGIRRHRLRIRHSAVRTELRPHRQLQPLPSC